MKINEVDKVTTLAATECITAIAEDESLIQIPVLELGKVMAQVMPVVTRENNGLLSPNIIFETMKSRGYIAHFDKNAIDNATETGFYKHDDSLFGTASGHGILLVFKGGSYIAQLDISNKGLLFMRFFNGFGDWTTWKHISFT